VGASPKDEKERYRMVIVNGEFGKRTCSKT
jgi:hypothetical protein